MIKIVFASLLYNVLYVLTVITCLYPVHIFNQQLKLVRLTLISNKARQFLAKLLLFNLIAGGSQKPLTVIPGYINACPTSPSSNQRYIPAPLRVSPAYIRLD